MIPVVEAIHRYQLIPQGDGTVTASIVKPNGIQCQNPDRPAVVGDVLSITPDGEIVARPAGTAGPWEKATVVGSSLVYAPNGSHGAAYLLPYAADVPNG